MTNSYEPRAVTDTWDSSSIEVFKRMDAVDSVSSMSDDERERIVSLGIKLFSNLEKVADTVLNSDSDERDSHIETLLLILAFTPNEDAMTYLREMTERRPDIYQVLFQSVIAQEPVRESGRIIRQRITFSMKRRSVVERVYHPDVSLALLSALESMELSSAQANI